MQAFRIDILRSPLPLSAALSGTRLIPLPGSGPEDVVAASDGSIFVGTSSARYTFRQWRLDIVEHLPTGMLLRRHPDGRVEKLLDGLQFGNGLTLALDSEGRIVHDCCWKDGRYSMVTGVCQHRGSVYLGSMLEPALLAFELPAP